MRNKNYKVLTIGDAMITFNPQITGPLRYVDSFVRGVGGAELNFAIGTARLGLKSKFISRIGKDDFGRYIYNFLRGEGIDVSDVKSVENYPTSLNIKEINNDGSGKTFYYRENSPILSLENSDINETMFKGVDLIHLTGVFLAISDSNKKIIEKIIEIARKKNIPISFDPNIRFKLWSLEKAKDTFTTIFPYIDILLTSLQELEFITESKTKKSFINFANKYSIKDLVIKNGSKGSMLFRDNKWSVCEAIKVEAVDTVGAGDGFDAAYIYGYLNNYKREELLKFANCAGAIVTTVFGDNEGLPYLEEINLKLNNKVIIER